MIDTTDIKEGDTLVGTSARRTVRIDSISEPGEDGGRTVEVTDSRRYGDDTWPLHEIKQAVKDHGFTVVRDSKLTEIKGIGPARAPELEVLTGCETPSELANAYLTDPEVAVHEHVPRVDYFKEWLVENIEELDVDATRDQALVMLFLNEFGAGGTGSFTDTVAVNGRHNTVDETALTIDHLEWADGSMWTDSANVAMVVYGDVDTALSRYKWYSGNLNGYDYLVDIERDGDHYVVTLGGNETWVSADYIDGICELFQAKPGNSLIKAHEDGDRPILIEVDGSDLTVVLAPRVRAD